KGPGLSPAVSSGQARPVRSGRLRRLARPVRVFASYSYPCIGARYSAIIVVRKIFPRLAMCPLPPTLVDSTLGAGPGGDPRGPGGPPHWRAHVRLATGDRRGTGRVRMRFS